jgi:multidrug efflux pump subunit AcrB
MIDIWLPQGASLKATEREVKRVEALLARTTTSPRGRPTSATARRASSFRSTSNCSPTTSARW